MSTHDDIAKKIARKYKTDYNPGKGVDVKTPDKAIEVEPNLDAITDGIRQLQGYKKSRYIAVPNRFVPDAIEKLKDTKIGVMDQSGNIKKQAKKPGK